MSASDKARTFALKRRTFVLQSEPQVSPSTKLISSVTVLLLGAHDHISVWNRGVHSGDLVMADGDGAQFATVLGLTEVEADE